MDSVDIEIISNLQEDERVDNAEIARRLRVSEETVRQLKGIIKLLQRHQDEYVNNGQRNTKELIQLLDEYVSGSQRVEAVNEYFKLKAAHVFEDDASFRLLVRLYQEVSLRYSEADIGDQGKALALLAAAGFCELGENRFQITETGKKFIDRINES